MNTAHKKHKASKKVTPQNPKSVLDVVRSEAPQPVKVVEPAKEVAVNPQPLPSLKSAAPGASDPLTDFKEKMNEEEKPVSNAVPRKNFMWPILFIFIIALAMLGGVFIYKQGVKTQEEINVVTLTPTPTIAPKPTNAEVDLSKYEIEILNGSEVMGEAGRQQSNLEAEGFTISTVGNADESNYTETIIQAKKEVDKDFLDKLKSVLEKSFVVGEVEELPQDADSGVIIIIGSQTN